MTNPTNEQIKAGQAVYSKLFLFFKAVVFDHAKQVMNPGGVMFGCTILNKGVKKGIAAKFMIFMTNRKKVFSNLDDCLDNLKQELSKRFKNVNANIIGCMAIFSAQL